MKQNKIAIVDREACEPAVCGYYLCHRVCPVDRAGTECITVSELDKKPLINEETCILCNICVKRCPVDAIKIVNLPSALKENPVHRYGANMFTLFRLPILKKNSVVSLIGQNGTGKSTVMKVLSGEMAANGGDYKKPDWRKVIDIFRGSELFEYLEKLSQGKIRVAYKNQNVDLIPNFYKGKVRGFLEKVDESGRLMEVCEKLRITNILEKNVESLSGGELQLFAIAGTMLKDRELYFFDEPSSYLDVSSRIVAGQAIRELAQKAMVLVVEHDLALADYLADHVHLLYGEPKAFGIVSKPYGVGVGINTYLSGYIKEENVRFRDHEISFPRTTKSLTAGKIFAEFGDFSIKLGGFSLDTKGGEIGKGEVMGILGPNGIGKTTFIKMLCGEAKAAEGKGIEGFTLSHKEQRVVIEKKHESYSVAEYLSLHANPADHKRIMHTLGLDVLLERKCGTLSGGELQALLIAESLMKESDIIMLDEPSAFLDVELRLRTAKLIRAIAEERQIPFFVVDHDLLFLDVISDRMIIFDGEPGVRGIASEPLGLSPGMNMFLKRMGVTFRRDGFSGRPRINKPGSQKDMEQKESGNYYYEE